MPGRFNPFVPNDALVAAIVAAMSEDNEANPFSRYGLRIDQGIRNLRVKEGQQFPASRRWVDGAPRRATVGGTSTIGVRPDPDGVATALKTLSPYLGETLHLIGGDETFHGDDPGEEVMRRGRLVRRFNAPEPRRLLIPVDHDPYSEGRYTPFVQPLGVGGGSAAAFAPNLKVRN